jgi:hypothetical protein
VRYATVVGPSAGEHSVGVVSGGVVLVVGAVDGAAVVDVAGDDTPPAHPTKRVRASIVVVIVRVRRRPVMAAACNVDVSNV